MRRQQLIFMCLYVLISLRNKNLKKEIIFDYGCCSNTSSCGLGYHLDFSNSQQHNSFVSGFLGMEIRHRTSHTLIKWYELVDHQTLSVTGNFVSVLASARTKGVKRRKKWNAIKPQREERGKKSLQWFINFSHEIKMIS